MRRVLYEPQAVHLRPSRWKATLEEWLRLKMGRVGRTNIEPRGKQVEGCMRGAAAVEDGRDGQRLG